MNYLSASSLPPDRLDTLYREAAAERLARLAARHEEPSGWRRLLGRGIRALSVGLGAASRRLDPTLDPARYRDGARLGA